MLWKRPDWTGDPTLRTTEEAALYALSDAEVPELREMLAKLIAHLIENGALHDYAMREMLDFQDVVG